VRGPRGAPPRFAHPAAVSPHPLHGVAVGVASWTAHPRPSSRSSPSSYRGRPLPHAGEGLAHDRSGRPRRAATHSHATFSPGGLRDGDAGLLHQVQQLVRPSKEVSRSEPRSAKKSSLMSLPRPRVKGLQIDLDHRPTRGPRPYARSFPTGREIGPFFCQGSGFFLLVWTRSAWSTTRLRRPPSSA
jgi:hypothetical protein